MKTEIGAYEWLERLIETSTVKRERRLEAVIEETEKTCTLRNRMLA